MKVKELIELLKTFDQEAEVWQMYDPPYSCSEIEIRHLTGDDADYAKMFAKEGVKESDYAVISG